MITFALVELDNGEQEFFDTADEAFKFARTKETEKTNSVDYVAIGNFYEDDGYIYEGQELRYILRSLDNVSGWLKESHEALRNEDV